MKKLFFILATLCFCSDGFPQNIKNNEVEYEKDILNKGGLEPFGTDLSDWRKFKNNDELNKDTTITESPTTGPTEPPTTGPTEPPTSGPTEPPTTGPTEPPTSGPTEPPTSGPTEPPTSGPTEPPTSGPTEPPTTGPTEPPTSGPTEPPTSGPTEPPTTNSTPRTTTPKGNGANTLSSISFSTFGISLLVHSIFKYTYR